MTPDVTHLHVPPVTAAWENLITAAAILPGIAREAISMKVPGEGISRKPAEAL